MTNALVTALEVTSTTKDALTANGMATHSTTNSALTDFFGLAGAMRNKPVEEVVRLFSNALAENKLDATRLMFYFRDAREGQGNRAPFRAMLTFLGTHFPEIVRKNIELIPFYGRFDDLFALVGTQCEVDALNIYARELRAGNGLAAKWAPREKSAKANYARALSQHMGLTPRRYRKMLSATTNVVESAMCAHEWNEIKFDHVPSVAMNRYTKAFARNASASWEAYKAALQKGEAKINAAVLYPHDIVYRIMFKDGDQVALEAQWKALPDYLGAENSILPIVDTSGSMTWTTIDPKSKIRPLDVAISLGLYTAERNRGPFKDAFITFAENPVFQKVQGATLKHRIDNAMRLAVGGSTALDKAIALVLNTAVANKVPQADMPKTLLIMSDMEFNPVQNDRYALGLSGFNPTAMEHIRAKYRAAGYEMPSVIYWNLNARPGNTPVKVHESGTALVSGFSPSILKYICTGVYSEITPYKMMRDVVDSDRYAHVTV